MRAIISVHDKTGLVDFARGLEALGVEIFSTGGTEAILRDSGIKVQGVEDLTGLPEMLDGRVKTLHPKVHGGILAVRDNPSHLQELEANQIQPIDLVVVNLYPFLATVEAGANLEQALEQIDIGGVTLLRASAKNFPHVVSVCDPRDYPHVLNEMKRAEGVAQDTRRRLAAKSFQHCAMYDTHIATYLRPHEDILPAHYTVAMSKVTEVRYGENPHQLAAFYVESTPRPRPSGSIEATQLHGKSLSFGNIYDADVAWRVVSDYQSTCVAITKRGSIVGLAVVGEGEPLVNAFNRALATDPQAAFGGAIAVNRQLDADAAREISSVFFEDLVAPSFSDEALAVLRKNQELRVFQAKAETRNAGPKPSELDYLRVHGGFLVQTRDALPEQSFTPEVVTQRRPTLEETTALLFAWRAVKHVRSNGVVLAKGLALVGVGAGQPTRSDAVDIAVRKAGERANGSVLASDGFFPFADCIDRAADAGVTAIIQPGGSPRDQEIIRQANKHGIAMIYTTERHYSH